MSMDLERKDFATSPEYFIADSTIRVITETKEAGEDLAAHTPVLLADGIVTAVASADALDGLYGICWEAAEVGEPAIILLAGTVFADSLTLPDGVDADDLEVAFRNIGIFLK